MLNFISQINKNPLYIKDKIIQERINSRRRFRYLPPGICYLCLLLIPMAVTCFIMYMDEQRIDAGVIRGSFIFSCYLQILYFCYRAISNSFSLIVREKEQRTFDSIISTTMSPGEILSGKFWIAFYPLAWELTALFPLFFLAGICTGISFFKLITVYLFTMGLTVFTVITGLWSSAKTKNSQQSHSWASSIMGVLIIGTFIMSMVLSCVASIYIPCDYHSREIVSFTPLFFNPVAGLSLILFAEEFSRNSILVYYISGALISMLVVYPLITVWLWKNSLKQFSWISAE
ncbi:MAG: hypothetical protein ABRQ37_09925 [Candidatus Eremiobacterota bacterium]